MHKESRWRLIGVFVMGWILFNFPFIKLFAIKKTILGLPVLYVYVFFIWACIILITKYTLDYQQKDKDKNLDI